MGKRAAGVVVGVLLAAGGLAAAGKWNDARIAACEQRSAHLSTLDLLHRHPDGFQPVPPGFGCDSDRVVAFVSRQFIATNGPTVDALSDRIAANVDEQDVTAFYQHVLRVGEWQISPRKATPGPNTASVCARKELLSGETYINLSFPVDGMYELTAADAAGAGAVCLW